MAGVRYVVSTFAENFEPGERYWSLSEIQANCIGVMKQGTCLEGLYSLFGISQVCLVQLEGDL
jgi:hypothetical protein